MARYHPRLCLLVLSLATLFGCEQETPKLTSEQLARFEWYQDGWTNQDRNTNHITRVHIYQVRDELRAHVWGRCSNMQCDWGEEKISLGADRETLKIIWKRSWKTSTQHLVRRPDGLLQITTHTQFRDAVRRDRKLVDRFERGMHYDWGPVAKEYFK